MDAPQYSSQETMSTTQLSAEKLLHSYQYGDPEVFAPYHANPHLVDVDGIILMRQHIWTFAVSGGDHK